MTTLTTVRVELAERSYSVAVGQGWLPEMGRSVAESIRGRRVAVVSNPDVAAHWEEPVVAALRGAGLEVETLLVPEGEEAKSLESVSAIYDFLIERRFDRKAAVVALGGGVVGDTVGFAAATFLRGVDFVQIPTTLLAMVDSSVGGKTGVNHRLGKNLIGAFKQPRFVGIDIDFLTTLPDAEFRSGMAEVVKYGVIADAEFFDFLAERADSILARDPEALTRVAARSCEIKAQVVSADEEESGLRAILNFGHTFAHAVENLTHYAGPRHGEAVAMGMVAACRLGEALGTFRREDTERVAGALRAFGLPTRLIPLPIEDMLNAMRSDKKTLGGRLRFVVPLALGNVEVRDVADEAIVRRAIEETL